MQDSTTLPVKIERLSQPGLNVTVIPHQAYREITFILHPVADETPESMFQRLSDLLKQHNVTVLRQTIFGPVEISKSCLQHLADIHGEIDWPITWIEGVSCTSAQLAGIIVRAATNDTDVQRIIMNDRPIGSVVKNNHVRYCHLAGIRATNPTLPRKEQATQTFDLMEAALQQAGMNFNNVVRTWLCMDDILAWYDDLNAARAEFFNRHQVFEKMVPASTGIGGPNHAGTAMIADVLALQPIDDTVKIAEVPSPLQCPALDYDSYFSRAAEVITPEYHYLYISGTASIAIGGETIHLDDMAKQIDWTFQVVEAILQSRGMKWSDVARGIAYCKYAKDGHIYQQYLQEKGLTDLPVVMAEGIVCRDDLLFELQIDGVASIQPAS